MGLFDCILRKLYLMAPNFTQYDEQFIVEKLDLMRRAAKRLLFNKSNFVRNTPQLKASCQSRSTNELITTQMRPQLEDSINAANNNSAITTSTNSSEKRVIQARTLNKFIQPTCQLQISLIINPLISRY